MHDLSIRVPEGQILGRTNIMEEHARFIAHLLDPDEFELIEKAMSASNIFRSLGGDSVGGTVAALAAEHGAALESLANRPEVDAVMSAVQSILDFKTQAVRDIEAGRIRASSSPAWPTTSVGGP